MWKEMLKSKLLVLAIFLLVLGIPGRLTLMAPDCFKLPTDFLNGSNENTTGYLYYKKDTAFPRPGIVLVHSFFQSPESVKPMAIFLARRGLVVLYLNLDPLTAEKKPRTLENYIDDVKAAAEYLTSSGLCVDGQVTLAGHSLGGNLAVLASYSLDEIPATISMGYPVEAGADRPRNLLISAGFFDELHPPDTLRKALSSATGGKERRSGVTSGSFHDGNARRLVLSPYSDHTSEMLDPLIWLEMVKWLEEGVPIDPLPWVNWELIAVPLAGVFILGLYLFWLQLLFFSHGVFNAAKKPSIFLNPGFQMLIVLTALGIAHFMVNLRGHSSWSDLLAELMLTNFLALLTASFLLRDIQHAGDGLAISQRSWLRPLKVLIAAGVCRLASIVLLAAPSMLSTPASILLTPAYIVSSPFNSIFLLESKLEHMILRLTEPPFILTWPAYLVLFADLLFPGAVLIPIAAFLRGVLNVLAGTVRLQLNFQASATSKVLLAILIVIAGGVWYLILSQGYALTPETMGNLGLLVVRLLVPVALFTVLLRSPYSPWKE